MPHDVIDQIRKLKAAGDLAAAERLAERALRNREPSRFDVLREVADIAAHRGHSKRAHAALDEAFTLLEPDAETSFDDRWCALMERRAWTFFREGDLRGSRNLCDQLLVSLRNLDDEHYSRYIADLQNTLAGIAWQEGRIDEAMAALSESITRCDRLHDWAGAAHRRSNLGVLCFARGDWRRAKRYLVQARRIHVKSKFHVGLSVTLLNLGLLEMFSGNLSAAERVLTDGIEACSVTGEAHVLMAVEIALAQLDLMRNHVDDASRRLDSVLSSSTLAEDTRVQALWLRALVLSAQGSNEKALEVALEARRRAKANEIPESESDACRTLGIIQRSAGRLGEAEDVMQEAVRLAEEAHDPYRRALALFELSIILQERAESSGDDARKAAAKEKGAEAMSIFSRLGARYHLLRARLLGHGQRARS